MSLHCSPGGESGVPASKATDPESTFLRHRPQDTGRELAGTMRFPVQWADFVSALAGVFQARLPREQLRLDFQVQCALCHLKKFLCSNFIFLNTFFNVCF